MNCYTVDDEGRIRIPGALPGQVLSVEPTPIGGWELVPVKAQRKDPFPPGSLLKYITPEYNRECMTLLKGCVGPPPEE